MPDSVVRTTFTRYRLGGAASLALPLAWLRVLGPFGGGPQILDPLAQDQRSTSAAIAIQRSYDVRIGDILKEGAHLAAGRVFLVRQVEPRADHFDLYHSSEIPPPIPDDFNSFAKEVFWTDPDTGFEVQSGTPHGLLKLTSMPAGTSPTAADKLYQLVKGDFDVWAEVVTDSGTAGNVRNSLIGAQLASDLTGTYVGRRHPNGGGNIEIVRYDVLTGPVTNTLVGPEVSLVNGWVRLKRTGTRVRTFHKITVGEPATENDWTEFMPSVANAFSSSAELRVGCFGFTNNSTQGEAIWLFFRNWSS